MDLIQIDQPVDQKEQRNLVPRHRRRFRNQPQGEQENEWDGLAGGDGYGGAFKGPGTDNPGDCGVPNSYARRKIRMRTNEVIPEEDVLGDQETRETKETNWDFNQMETR